MSPQQRDPTPDPLHPSTATVDLPGETTPGMLTLDAGGLPVLTIAARRRQPVDRQATTNPGVTETTWTWRGRRWILVVRVLATPVSRWFDHISVTPRGNDT